MKILFLIITALLLFSKTNTAQTPDDALRNAWFIPNGTARNIAIGGAMGSLGGDISANNINPAGIGLFKTMEVVATPVFSFNNNDIDFRGTPSSISKSNFSLGPTGFIAGGMPNRKGSGTYSFSISVNQLAGFNNHIYYKGINNVSSFSEQYLEELVANNADTISALSDYIFGSSLAFRTYLIDKVIDTFGNLIGYQTLVPVSTGVTQENDETSRGSIYEISLAYADNKQDKLYLGASLNIPLITYKNDRVYKESDISNDPNNNFNYFKYTENFKSSGIGVNAKLGLIYKPQEMIRLGLAIHTPSFIFFTDEISAVITTDTEGYAGTLTESSDNLNNNAPGQRQYMQLTPWKIIGSASYVFREAEDIRQQRGFVTADIEFVNYQGARFYSSGSAVDVSSTGYYDELNSVTKNYLKGNFNFRLGGELKFNLWAFRLGGAYYGSPYEDKILKASRSMLSGGIGYRNHGIFIDMAYAYTINKDVNFPYRLNDKPNTFATLNNKRSNIIFTVGVKI